MSINRPESDATDGYEISFCVGVTASELVATRVRLDATLDDDAGTDTLRVVCTIAVPDDEDVSRRYYRVEALGMTLRDALTDRAPRWTRCSTRVRGNADLIERLWNGLASAALRAQADRVEAEMDAYGAEQAEDREAYRA